MPKFPTDDHTAPELTEFPKAWSKDVLMQARIAEERWRRAYPLIPYYCISKAVTPRTDLEDFNELVGEDGTTKFDPLWREPVQATPDGQWTQPHTTDAQDATVRQQYQEAIKLHATVRMNGTEYQLKRLGFDEVKDLILFMPILFFDRYGKSPTAGDKLEWDGDAYYVLETKKVGYWKNSNIRIYYAINAERKRKGS